MIAIRSVITLGEMLSAFEHIETLREPTAKLAHTITDGICDLVETHYTEEAIVAIRRHVEIGHIDTVTLIEHIGGTGVGHDTPVNQLTLDVVAQAMVEASAEAAIALLANETVPGRFGVMCHETCVATFEDKGNARDYLAIRNRWVGRGEYVLVDRVTSKALT